MAGIFLWTGKLFFFQLVLRQSLGLEENSMTDQQREQIRTMRLQGAGYIKIGKALGISDNTVRSFCRFQKVFTKILGKMKDMCYNNK